MFSSTPSPGYSKHAPRTATRTGATLVARNRVSPGLISTAFVKDLREVKKLSPNINTDAESAKLAGKTNNGVGELIGGPREARRSALRNANIPDRERAFRSSAPAKTASFLCERVPGIANEEEADGRARCLREEEEVLETSAAHVDSS